MTCPTYHIRNYHRQDTEMKPRHKAFLPWHRAIEKTNPRLVFRGPARRTEPEEIAAACHTHCASRGHFCSQLEREKCWTCWRYDTELTSELVAGARFARRCPECVEKKGAKPEE